MEFNRGEITEQDVIDSLPDPSINIKSAGLAYKSVELSEDEVFLLTKRSSFQIGRRATVGQIGISKRLLHKLPMERTVTFVPEEKDVDDDDPDEINIEECLNLSIGSHFLPPRWLFTEEEAITAFISFQNKLQKIEDGIIERNKGLDVPYEVLLPSKIPFGITI